MKILAQDLLGLGDSSKAPTLATYEKAIIAWIAASRPHATLEIVPDIYECCALAVELAGPSFITRVQPVPTLLRAPRR